MKGKKRNYRQQQLIDDVIWLVVKLMKKNKVTQNELARRTKRPKQQISQILSGKVNLTLETVSDLLHALGRDYLFKRSRLLHESEGALDSSSTAPPSAPPTA
jgi:transcriptional regulator with XRE-family HTH domain